MTKKSKATKQGGGLARALRSRIGRMCHFTHPETGEVVEGIYKRGRKVEKLNGIKGVTKDIGGGRTYDFETTTYTVPHHVKITFGGPKPKRSKALDAPTDGSLQS